MLSSLPISKTVIVTGATGRLGRLVVNELIQESNVNITVRVRALVRDIDKASTVLPNSPLVDIVKCDLNNDDETIQACANGDAVIWCATGFSDSPNTPLYKKLIAAASLFLRPTKTIDIDGIKRIGEIFSKRAGFVNDGPKVVLVSSAGVTRTVWSDDKKKKYEGCADIPIVRLNPLKILDVKRSGEEALRNTKCSYSIVRPCGLTENWSSGRPLLSQGDVAVGRTTRPDVAKFLVSVLKEPSSCSKTFEMFAIPGFPYPRDFKQQFQRLKTDSGDVCYGSTMNDEQLDIEYGILQQLVPGETLAPNQLAMGQTYEQLDSNKVGRLGKRGEEAPPIFASQ